MFRGVIDIIKYKFIIKKRIISKIGKVGDRVKFAKDCRIIGGENISIGDDFYSECSLRLQTWESYRGRQTGYHPSLIIGNKVSIMSNCQISCMNNIEIGDGCLLGNNVFITDNAHGAGLIEELMIAPIERKLYSKGPVKIGKNVWIGRNVCILSNVSIGDGCVIGANSVVTHNIPSYSVAVGSPARIIKKYCQEEC